MRQRLLRFIVAATVMMNQARPRIYWFETAGKWAISAGVLSDPQKAQAFVAALRQRCRAIFNEMVRAWVVEDSQIDAAKEIVRRYYGNFEFVERPRARPTPPPPPQPVSCQRSPAYIVFCALVGYEDGENLSYDRARALYRHAAAHLHPDAGGSADEMAALNVAWVAVRELLT